MIDIIINTIILFSQKVLICSLHIQLIAPIFVFSNLLPLDLNKTSITTQPWWIWVFFVLVHFSSGLSFHRHIVLNDCAHVVFWWVWCSCSLQGLEREGVLRG